jgi:hypothetical protein
MRFAIPGVRGQKFWGIFSLCDALHLPKTLSQDSKWFRRSID